MPEDKQNPLISTAGTIGGGIALYELATKGIVNGAYLVKTKFPKINKGIAKLADKVNNSSIINKPLSYIEKGAKSIATKFPKTANFIAKNYFAIGLGAFIAGTVLFNKKINNTKEQVYMETMNKLNNNENIEDLC